MRTSAPGSAPAAQRASHVSPSSRTWPSGKHAALTTAVLPISVSAPTTRRRFLTVRFHANTSPTQSTVVTTNASTPHGDGRTSSRTIATMISTRDYRKRRSGGRFVISAHGEGEHDLRDAASQRNRADPRDEQDHAPAEVGSRPEADQHLRKPDRDPQPAQSGHDDPEDHVEHPLEDEVEGHHRRDRGEGIARVDERDDADHEAGDAERDMSDLPTGRGADDREELVQRSSDHDQSEEDRDRGDALVIEAEDDHREQEPERAGDEVDPPQPGRFLHRRVPLPSEDPGSGGGARVAHRPRSGSDRAGSRQRPDHPDVEGDDDERPPRVVREEEEVRDRAQHRERDRGHAGPRAIAEEGGAGHYEEDAENEVDPAPGRDVEVERVVLRRHEELVVDQRSEAREDLERADQEEHRGGERDAAHRPRRRARQRRSLAVIDLGHACAPVTWRDSGGRRLATLHPTGVISPL